MLVTECHKMYEATSEVGEVIPKCTIPNRGFLPMTIGFSKLEFFPWRLSKANRCSRNLGANLLSMFSVLQSLGFPA